MFFFHTPLTVNGEGLFGAKTMEKIKIGKGYYPLAYGNGYQKNCTIYSINGKAYAYNSRLPEYSPEFKEHPQYIRVNLMPNGQYSQVLITDEHKKL